jgi:hypothetical protein
VQDRRQKRKLNQQKNKQEMRNGRLRKRSSSTPDEPFVGALNSRKKKADF